MNKVHISELKEIDIAERKYRDKSNRYSRISMWWLLPLFIGNIIMAFQIEIGFTIWIVSIIGGIYYCFLSNRYFNKFRKEINRIFKKYNK